MINKPTRGDNILDLFLTTNPALVNSVEILPGFSDHDISISNVSVKPKIKGLSHYTGKLSGLVSNLLCRFTFRKFWLASKKVPLRKSGMLSKLL